MDQPEDVIAEALPTGLRVTWDIKEKFWIGNKDIECEIQLYEKDSYTEVSLSPRAEVCVLCVVYE